VTKKLPIPLIQNDSVLKILEVGLGAGTSTELETADQFGLGLIHIWTVNDIKRPVWRIIIFILFWAGLLMVGFPAAVTFLQVTIVAAKHLIAKICL
jgi:hypothetical protein